MRRPASTPPAPPRRVLDQCAAYLRAGVWVHFFPEGTRMLNVASTSPMGPFKAGAFKLAKDCGEGCRRAARSCRDGSAPHVQVSRLCPSRFPAQGVCFPCAATLPSALGR